MIDQTLTQILNEVYRLTNSVLQASRDLDANTRRISELEAQVADATATIHELESELAKAQGVTNGTEPVDKPE